MGFAAEEHAALKGWFASWKPPKQTPLCAAMNSLRRRLKIPLGGNASSLLDVV